MTTKLPFLTPFGRDAEPCIPQEGVTREDQVKAFGVFLYSLVQLNTLYAWSDLVAEELGADKQKLATAIEKVDRQLAIQFDMPKVQIQHESKVKGYWTVKLDGRLQEISADELITLLHSGAELVRKE